MNHAPGTTLIDTHCHLDFPEFNEDRQAVIESALKQGLEYIVNIGSSLSGSEKSVELARRYQCVYAAVGLHPHEAGVFSEDALKKLKILAADKKVVAIGETGLDFFKNYSPQEAQRSLFSAMILLAKECSLPLVIHCRDAQDEILDILKKEMPLKAVVHCFSGDERFLRECMDLGFSVSFTCNITYKKASSLRSLVKEVSLERLMLETDAPFLSPEGFRGRRNEPMQVNALAQVIAQIRGLSFEEIAGATTKNAKSFFGLP
jgi:TatD DNase family protein